jgi:hypothetical protein
MEILIGLIVGLGVFFITLTFVIAVKNDIRDILKLHENEVKRITRKFAVDVARLEAQIAYGRNSNQGDL